MLLIQNQIKIFEYETTIKKLMDIEADIMESRKEMEETEGLIENNETDLKNNEIKVEELKERISQCEMSSIVPLEKRESEIKIVSAKQVFFFQSLTQLILGVRSACQQLEG